MRASLLACASFAWLVTSSASATFSVVAVDTDNDEVGGAGASCVGATVSVYRIFASAPGRGVVHIQAELGQPARRALALRELAAGTTPADIIRALTAPDFDPLFGARQYGVVDIMGRTAAFTGDDTQPIAVDEQGRQGPFAFSAQGNVLTGSSVVEDLVSSFELPRCDLAEALMLALEAGAEDGGDARCAAEGIPADGAFLQVDRPGEPSGSYLHLQVDDATGDAIVALRGHYDAWRAEHPCVLPVMPDAGAGPAGPRSHSGCSVGSDMKESWLFFVWVLVWARLHVAKCRTKR